MRIRSLSACTAIWAALSLAAAASGSAAETGSPPGFHDDVLPILEQHCSQCHSPGGIAYHAISLDLSTYRGVMAGSSRGQAVIPHQPQMSPLVKVLDWKNDTYPHMPANSHELAPEDVKTIVDWVAAGAKDN